MQTHVYREYMHLTIKTNKRPHVFPHASFNGKHVLPRAYLSAVPVGPCRTDWVVEGAEREIVSLAAHTQSFLRSHCVADIAMCLCTFWIIELLDKY